MSTHRVVAESTDPLASFMQWLVHLRGAVGTSLMQRIGSADQRAFADFYDLTAPRVLAVVRTVITDPDMAEQLTADIFVEFWTTAPAHTESFEPLRSVILHARYRAEERRILLEMRTLAR